MSWNNGVPGGRWPSSSMSSSLAYVRPSSFSSSCFPPCALAEPSAMTVVSCIDYLERIALQLSTMARYVGRHVFGVGDPARRGCPASASGRAGASKSRPVAIWHGSARASAPSRSGDGPSRSLRQYSRRSAATAPSSRWCRSQLHSCCPQCVTIRE